MPRYPTPSILPPQSFLQTKLGLSHSYAQNKAPKDHRREFPGYWWLFQMQHLSHYGTRLAAEEERKNDSDCLTVSDGL